jgi:hypothetical protein
MLWLMIDYKLGMLKRYKILIALVILLTTKYLAQDASKLRYSFIHSLEQNFYLIDGEGNQLKNVELKDYSVKVNRGYDHFSRSKYNIYFTRKSDQRIYSLHVDGKFELLDSELIDVHSINDNYILFHYRDKMSLYNAEMELIKTLSNFDTIRVINDGIIAARDSKSTDWYVCNDKLEPIHNIGSIEAKNLYQRFKSINKEITAIKMKETAEWHLCDNNLNSIHNMGVDILGYFAEYGEGWTLVYKLDQDKIFYNISGSKFNLTEFLYKKLKIKISDPNELNISMVFNNIICVKVGYEYFKVYYINISSNQVIWKSENLDIKSASDFKKGFANIEKYNTTFEEYIKEQKLRYEQGIKYERTYQTLEIDTTGSLIPLGNEDDIVLAPMINTEIDGNILYSDNYRLLVSKMYAFNKVHLSLIDNFGKVYWQNFIKP